MSKLSLAFVVAMQLLCSSCMLNRYYRDNSGGESRQSVFSPSGTHSYYQAFIEFDEFGELWDHNQVNLALQLIDQAKKATDVYCNGRKISNELQPAIRLVVFIHGWKNNASDDSGNVWGFRKELQEISDVTCPGSRSSMSLMVTTQKPEPLPVVGIYFGWRGGTIKVPVLKEFTYWDRRDVAQTIPGADMTGVLNEILAAAKKGDPEGRSSVSIVIGHSFGGQVLERTITQATVQYLFDQQASYDQNGKTYVKPPPADLVVLLNSAAAATESHQLLEILKTNEFEFTISPIVGPNGESVQSKQPLIVAMTSTGDTGTGIALPIGQGVSLLKKSTREYKSTEQQPPGITNQRTYYLHSTANIEKLRSHSVYLCSDGDPKTLANLKDPLNPLFVFCRDSVSPCPADRLYCIGELKDPWNTTPYWVMALPTEIVPDHTSVFGTELVQLLNAFISARPSTAKPLLQQKLQKPLTAQ